MSGHREARVRGASRDRKARPLRPTELTTPPSAEPELGVAVADLDAPTPARRQPAHAEESPPARPPSRRAGARPCASARPTAGSDEAAPIAAPPSRRRPRPSRTQRRPTTMAARTKARSRAAPAGGRAAFRRRLDDRAADASPWHAMKSGWVDADAEALVARGDEVRHRPRSGAARLHDAAARPRSASSCCMAAATPR